MTYTFTYDGANPPKWEKSFTASSGETFTVPLVFENEDERLMLTAAQIYEHMENMLQFVKDRTQEISLVQLNEPVPNTFWPLHGNYDQIEKTLTEIQKWWQWTYYNNAFDVEEPEE